MFLPGQQFVTGFRRFIFRLDGIILLASNGILGQKVLIAFIFTLRIFQPDFSLLYPGIGNGDIVLSRMDSRRHHRLSGQGILIISLRLCHPETEFGLFNQSQRIAFMHFLVFREIDFLDKARYAAVHRHDLLANLRIIGKFDIP